MVKSRGKEEARSGSGQHSHSRSFGQFITLRCFVVYTCIQVVLFKDLLIKSLLLILPTHVFTCESDVCWESLSADSNMEAIAKLGSTSNTQEILKWKPSPAH